MRRHVAWVVVSLLALSTVVATTGPADASVRRASAPSGQPIKVGVICSCSGAFGSNVAPAAKVVDAWAKSVNANGGLNGHPVDVTVADDASTPGTSVARAQSMISDNVDVILDLTVLDAAWADAVTAAKIPVVGGSFSNTVFYQNPNFYPSGQTNDSIVYANVLTAKKAGAKNFGQLYCAEAPICQESVAPHQAAGKKLGVPDVYNASISATAPNYTAQCLAAQQAGVKALFIGHSSSVVARVAADCDRQGYKPIYITEGTGFSMQLTSAPGIKDKLWSPYPILPFYANEPAVKSMNAALDKYQPGLRQDQNAWSEFAAQAWTGGLLIGKAVQASGMAAGDAPSAATITKGLDATKNETLDGWSPPLTFTAGKAHSVDCWFTARMRNGKPTLVNGGKQTCHSPSA
jgi:branched-chain amino acid transport system substrate-binding protein